MLIKHSQQNIIINHKPNITRIGIKMSGGADSSIVAYILSKYIIEERPDIKLIPITVNHFGKLYQYQFSKKIIQFIKNNVGDVFLEHYLDECKTGDTYASTQNQLVDQLYKKRIIQQHYVGITQNPPNDIMDIIGWNGPLDDRSPHIIRDTITGTSYKPLININKKGVKELYETFGLLKTLFPLTRSCEEFTNNFSKHCEKCWFCKERYWGFEKY